MSSSLGIALNYLAKEDVNAMKCKMKIILTLPLIQRLEIICLFTFLSEHFLKENILI